VRAVRFLNSLILLSKNDAISENVTLLFISTSMSGSKLSKYFGTCPEKQLYAHRARNLTDRLPIYRDAALNIFKLLKTK
jgi:hypothetical protein